MKRRRYSTFTHTLRFIRTILLLSTLLVLCQRVSGQVPQPHVHHRRQSSSSPEHETHASAEDKEQELVCVPAGVCEPCPVDSLHEPFCQPFGTRRLMSCTTSPPNTTDTPPNTNTDANTNTETPPNDPSFKSTHPHLLPAPPSPPPPHFSLIPSTLTIPAFEPCGRIPSLERYDFFEFIAFNLGVGVLAVGGVVVRMRRGRVRQLRAVAARIGLGGTGAGAGGGNPGGWRGMVGG